MKVEHFDQSEVTYWKKEGCTQDVTIGTTTMVKRVQRCKHKAAFVVNGRKLCQLHAGQEALRLALAVAARVAQG